ncbi:hypothetical protein [Ruegeria sp. EL01]|jgi:hypothetical protein|uniref:hypothetical protein n=1 Tax=Ruegeria sp. EL01 TaxID=2107578 RepID=UPI000EA81D34|nr:hypothetical protein [Ruegeria sp. EL01]
MTGQSSAVPELFLKRVELINSLSQANVGHLRILQQIAGYDILLMKDPNSEETLSAMEMSSNELTASQEQIDTLERDVAKIDEQIEQARNLEDE